MASIVVNGDTSGAVTLSAPAVAGTVTVTLPTTTGTMLTTASSTGISGSAISSGTVPEAYGGTGTSTGYYGFKNRIINGAMVIAQRGTSFAGASTSTYCVDRTYLSISTCGTWTLTQDSDVPSGSGFANSFKAVCTSATASPNQLRIVQNIEGYNISDSCYGTVSAKSYTLSFWIKTNKTGTYSVSFETTTSGRYYTTNFTVSVSNTWEFKTIVISGDTSGTLNTTNGVGLALSIWLGAGSSLTGVGTQNAWITNGTYSSIAQGQTAQLADTVSNYFNITGVQLEKGSTATSFDYRPYGTELALCQRYFIRYGGYELYGNFGIGIAGGTAIVYFLINFPVQMRSTPSVAGSTLQLHDTTAGFTVTSVAAISGEINPQAGYISASVASGLTTFRPYFLRTNNSTSGFLNYSAEL